MTVETRQKIHTIEEIGIDYMIGKEPLRQRPLDRFDILRSTTNNHKSIQMTIKTLASQYGYYVDKHFSHIDNKSYKYYSIAINFLLGKIDLPLPVLITSQAILGYDCSPFIDPQTFTKKVEQYTPSLEELEKFGLNQTHLVVAYNNPATLIGTAALVHWDGIDENQICMRKTPKGPYTGKYTTGGGHADSSDEIASFEEVIEETGIPSGCIRNARPVGTADQVVVVQTPSGKIGLRRYLNLVWQIPLPLNHRLKSDSEAEWEIIDDDQIGYLQRENKLTPIADFVIRTIKI